MSPTIKKSAWTPEEDKLLLDLYATHGTKWAQIARHIQGRTDDACSKRYREALDPALRHDEWTPEEDARLVEIHASQGGRWKEVGMELGRGSLSCRNRCLLPPNPTLVYTDFLEIPVFGTQAESCYKHTG